MNSVDWLVLALAALATAVGVLLAALSMRYRRDRRVFLESKDIVSSVVRVFGGRLQKQEELLGALGDTVRHVLKTQEEQQARVDRITEHVAHSMDLERRLIGVLARLGEKVNQVLLGSAVREKAAPLGGLTMDAGVAPIETALSKLTPTELKALQLLAVEGPLPSPNIRRIIGKSREHTARLMKRLYEQGYVDRETSRIPYRYRVNEKVRGVLEKKEKDRAKQSIEQRAQEKGVA